MNRKTSLIATSILFIAYFYSLTSLTPMTSDDYTISFMIRSGSDVLRQARENYFFWDGRFSAYLMNYGLMALPDLASQLLRAFPPFFLIVLITMHALGSSWKQTITWKHLCCSFCLVWLSLPTFGQAFLWETGMFYGAYATLFMLFLWPYRLLLEREDAPMAWFWLLIPLAVWSGLGDFNTSLATAILAFAIAGYHVLKIGKWRLAPFIPPLLLLICFAVIYLAPGNAVRLKAIHSGYVSSSLMDNIISHLGSQKKIQAFFMWPYLLMVLSFFVLWRERNQVRGSTAGSACVSGKWSIRCRLFLVPPHVLAALGFFLAAQAAQLAFMFSPAAKIRVYTSSVVFMIAAALSLASYACSQLRERNAYRRLFRLFWAPASALWLFTLLMTLMMFHENKRNDQVWTKTALSAPPGSSICLPAPPYHSDSWFFCGRELNVHDNPSYWVNIEYARYYNLASVTLCPENFSITARDANGDSVFQGQVNNSVLSFSYTPSQGNADKPFIFVFAPLPGNPARKIVDPLLERCLENVALFRRTIPNRYLKATPDALTPHPQSGEKTITGTARLPHLEHAHTGYILHYDGKIKNITALVPLSLHRDN